MTAEEVRDLSDEEVRVKVAELCGRQPYVKRWKFSYYHGAVWSIGWHRQEDCQKERLKLYNAGYEGISAEDVEYDEINDCIPYYPRDLNAVHEIEQTIIRTDGDEYRRHLKAERGIEWGHSTARQRCEALLLTLLG